jgi:hypothetical protein
MFTVTAVRNASLTYVYCYLIGCDGLTISLRHCAYVCRLTSPEQFHVFSVLYTDSLLLDILNAHYYLHMHSLFAIESAAV